MASTSGTGAPHVVETVDHMRNLVLAAAYLAYRRSGLLPGGAHLLGLPPSRSDIYDWLVRCVTPGDEVVRARGTRTRRR